MFGPGSGAGDFVAEVADVVAAARFRIGCCCPHRKLLLASNALSGTLPATLSTLSALQYVDDISASVVMRCCAGTCVRRDVLSVWCVAGVLLCRELRLANNQLIGAFPAAVSALQTLT